MENLELNIPYDLYEEIIKNADINTLFQLYHTNKYLKYVIDKNISFLNDKFIGMYGITKFYDIVMWYYYTKLKIDNWEDINTLEGQFISAIENLDYYYNPARPGYKYKDDVFIKKLITFLNKYGYSVDVNNLDHIKEIILTDVINKRGKYTKKGMDI
jgi:hypothetical protein